MKRITILFVLVIICLIGGVTYSQNPAWILPPKYETGSLHSLPTSPTSHNASNMQMDANGDILFYIVNNIVYDKDGDLIANLSTYYNANHPNAPYTMEAPNASEVAIVPVPDKADCSSSGIYYIFTCADLCQGCKSQGGDVTIWKADAFVAVLDFGVPRPNSNKMGAITSVERLSDLPATPSNIDIFMEIGGCFAASKQQGTPGNYFRYIFAAYYGDLNHNAPQILRYKLSATGLQYDGSIAFQPHSGVSIGSGERAEMELIETRNGHLS